MRLRSSANRFLISGMYEMSWAHSVTESSIGVAHVMTQRLVRLRATSESTSLICSRSRVTTPSIAPASAAR
jgi:hypothetical protein